MKKLKGFHLDFIAGICMVLSVTCFVLSGQVITSADSAFIDSADTYSESYTMVSPVQDPFDEYVTEIADRNISEETIETGEETTESNEVEFILPKAYEVSSDCAVPVYESADTESTVLGYILNDDVVVATPRDDTFAEFMVEEKFAYISLECLEEYVVNIQPVQEMEVVDNFTPTTSICSVSGLTEDEISYLLEGSYMEDYAYLYYNAEKTYGINAYYMLAVSQLESGWGRSNAGMNYNNIFGLMTSRGGFQYFESKQDCVEYWLDLMERFYIGRGLDSPSTIGPVYCTTGEWPNVICKYMNDLVSRVERYRQSSL